MKTIPVGPNREPRPVFIQGLMRTDHMSVDELLALLHADLEYGLTFLDTSDIYSNGYCETLLGQAFAAEKGLREKFILQTKCGIRRSPKGFSFYDFSEKHILEAADASLKRLQTDHIDYYLLHRPDALFEPEEIASAFDKLHSSGKVARFGVSNMNTAQMSYLKKYVKQPIEVNQLQFNVAHTLLVDSAIMTNRVESLTYDTDLGLLDYCRMSDCTIQAWSPFRASKSEFSGSIIDRFARKIETRVYLDNPEFSSVNNKLKEFSKQYSVSPAAVSIAWILRHPAGMQIVLGSSKPARILDAMDALKIELSREDWYELYVAGGNIIP